MAKIKAIAKKNKKRIVKMAAISIIAGLILSITGIYVSPYIWAFNAVKAVIKAAAK